MPYRFAEAMMGMRPETWARHANPWSGWTRIATFPLWFLALWSWTWIGWWCLLPVLLLAIWTWLNPRLFPACEDDTAWITRGVLGEQLFLARARLPIPKEHVRVAHLLTGLALAALIAAIVGLALQIFWLALGGWLLAVTFKLWFVDRMAWLYADVKASGATPPPPSEK